MRRTFRPILIAIVALLPASCDQTTVSVLDDVDPLGWITVDQFSRQPNARAVWGTASNDVYAGYGGYAAPDHLKHFDGTNWESISLGDNYGVYDIWSSAPDDVYVAATTGLWHFDGATWVNTGFSATVVKGHDADHVIATDGHTLVRLNGAAQDTLLALYPYGPSIRSCWIGAGSTVLASVPNYAAGDSLYRYDGATWSGLVGAPGWINDMLGDDESDLIAVGSDPNYNGRVWQWDGAQFTEMPIPAGTRYLSGAFALGTNIYAAGCDMLLYNGVSWEPFDTPDGCIQDVWASSDADVYGAGGVLQRFDGTGWSPVFELTPDEPSVIWAESHRRMVVAGGGSVFRLEDGIWTKDSRDSLRTPVSAFAGRSWSDLYASTWDGVYHWDGAVWMRMPGSPRSMRRLFVLPGGDLFATDGPQIYRHDARGWTLIREPNDGYVHTASLWALAADDVLAGDGDGISRFDGVSWKRIDREPGWDLLAFSPRDIFSLSDGGRLRHSSGGEFEWVGPVLPEGANQLAGTSPDHVVAVGRGSYMAHHDGQWIVGTEPKSRIVLDLVPASDGSVIRLDFLGENQFQIWYHRE